MIDLRSDTVTKPTDEMRKAMANADVGDDVYRDDPTTNKLETIAAEFFGKEAALFVPSGTFANQLALLTWTNPGNEIILGDKCHIIEHEAGAAGLISGINTSQIPSSNGELPIEEINKRIRAKDIHHPKTTLICTENAHSSGNVITLEDSKKIYELAQKNGIPVHTDGARFINAAVYLNEDVVELAKYSDSLNICLSKGLCAPIGSLLLGEKDFIEKARYYRKILGGGMRQVGIIAAAGIIALTEMSKRLNIDHENASYLGKELSKIDGVGIDFDNLKINMLFYKIDNKLISDDKFTEELKNKDILINAPEEGYGRLVTHNEIDKKDIDYFVESVKNIFK